MMKPDKTKEMTGGESNVKQKDMDHTPQIRKPKKLRCIRESEMPSVGIFQAGDIIEDQRIVAIVADNPNFEDISEGGSL
jgi:hypothetical protein